MNKKIIAVVLGSFFLAGCNLFPATDVNNTDTAPVVDDSVMMEADEQNAVNPVGTESEAMMAEDVQEFTIEGSNFKFSPNVMKVKQGDTVRITFQNVDGLHDLKIDEFNVATEQIAAGASETVEFVADKAGEFEYYCSVGQHRQNGMVGTLVVE